MYKQIKDNGQWLYAIKSNKKVRFTEKFLTLVTLNGMDKIEPSPRSSMTTKEIHLVKCKMSDFLSNEYDKLEEKFQKLATMKETMVDNTGFTNQDRAVVNESYEKVSKEKAEKLDLMRHLIWDERKFNIIEVEA